MPPTPMSTAPWWCVSRLRNCQMDLVVKAIEERTNKPLKQVIIQEVGGTLKAVEIAVRYAKEMVAEASMLQKEEFPLSELIVGTECGGSDPTSGLAANPAIGAMSDLVVQAGGTSILSETARVHRRRAFWPPCYQHA